MKVKQVYIWQHHTTGNLQVKATVEVVGLGDVQFEAALSQETIDRIVAEVVVALRIRLGQQQ